MTRLNVPVAAVVPEALRLTLTVQLAPAASVVLHVPPAAVEKPVPETVAAPMLKGPTPVLVSVALPVVVLPAATLPNEMALRVAACDAPIPLKATTLLPAPVANVTTPDWLPATVGANATSTEQLAPAAKLAEQVLLEIWKFDPTVTAPTLNGPTPVLVSVAFCAAETVPTCVSAKFKLVLTAAIWSTPVPFRPTEPKVVAEATETPPV